MFLVPTTDIRSFYLNEKHKPIFTKLFLEYHTKNFGFPFCYDILGEWAYPLGGFEGSMNSPTSFTIWRTPIIHVDPTTFAENNKKFWDELLEQYPDEPQKSNAINQVVDSISKSRNKFSISPFNNFMLYQKETIKNKNKIKNRISFDFFIIDDTHFEFFIRDHRIISRWEANLVMDENQRINRVEWNEITTYSNDSITLLPIKNSEISDLTSSPNVKTFAIQDSAFFHGQIKITKQNNNIFIINTQHGGIYWVGPNSIEKVGEINLQQYPKILLGKPYFIEDRKNNQLIFFSKINQINKNHPFPKIKILNSKEIEKQFEAVLK